MTDKSSPDKSERRPLSQYDNLASVSIIGTSPPVREELMFKDIKFQFDDINHGQASTTTSTSSPYPPQKFNKSVISDAKSIFFGLHKPPNNGTQKDENLPLMAEQESISPKVTTPVASKLGAAESLLNTTENQNNSTNPPVSATAFNTSNSSNNNNTGNGSSKKQITLLVDDNDTSQRYLNDSSTPSQVIIN